MRVDERGPWRAQVLTLFPDMFPGPLGFSLAGRALAAGNWSLKALDIRQFACNRHRSVDDTPAGGGPGMVMRVDILARAVDAALAELPHAPVLVTSPRGVPFTQARARSLAAGVGVTLLCGRFEGVDERLFEGRVVEPVSVGDYVLSGGEVAAMAIIDACVRLVPGVMGAAESAVEESFETGLLEYPHYTRPQTWEGLEIPEVLRSGDHKRISDWRRARSEEDTRRRRPDLWREALAQTVVPGDRGHESGDSG
jgi:tRNA (guanine37-N1)-methyltransferase